MAPGCRHGDGRGCDQDVHSMNRYVQALPGNPFAREGDEAPQAYISSRKSLTAQIHAYEDIISTPYPFCAKRHVTYPLPSRRRPPSSAVDHPAKLVAAINRHCAAPEHLDRSIRSARMAKPYRPRSTSSIPSTAGPTLGLGSTNPIKASNSNLSASCSNSSTDFFLLIARVDRQ